MIETDPVPWPVFPPAPEILKAMAPPVTSIYIIPVRVKRLRIPSRCANPLPVETPSPNHLNRSETISKLEIASGVLLGTFFFFLAWISLPSLIREFVKYWPARHPIAPPWNSYRSKVLAVIFVRNHRNFSYQIYHSVSKVSRPGTRRTNLTRTLHFHFPWRSQHGLPRLCQ